MSQTLFEKRTALAARRERWRAEQRCIECGSADLAIKKDETPATRCTTHFRTSSGRSPYNRAVSREDYDVEYGSGGYLDDPVFHEYTERVGAVVAQISAELTAERILENVSRNEDPTTVQLAGVTTRMIHAQLGDAARIHWTADALWMLKVANQVRHGDTIPTRWYPVSPTTASGSTFDQADAEHPPANSMRAAA